MSAPRGGWPLPCGSDLGDLVRQVADGVQGDLEHQATCRWCQGALAELTRLWELVAELAAERVPLPARLDQAIMLRVRRAMFLAAVARFFNGLLPRLGWALLTYTGLARPQRGEAR